MSNKIKSRIFGIHAFGKGAGAIAGLALSLGIALAAAAPANALTYSNMTGWVIPDTGSVTAGTTGIGVPALYGAVTKVTVELIGLTHPNTVDLDVILTGPLGQNTYLLNAHGGSNPFAGSLGFDDDAATMVPIFTALVDGSTYYLETPVFAPDPLFPAEATNALATYIGLDPAGTWGLTIGDVGVSSATGYLEGWSITFEGVTDTPPTGTVSEPASMAVVGLGMVAFGWIRRRNQLV